MGLPAGWGMEDEDIGCIGRNVGWCLFGMHWGKLKYNHVVLLCPGIVWKRDWLLHVSGMAKSVVWPAQTHTRTQTHLSVMCECVCAREFDGIICIISKCLTFHSTAPVSSFPLEYIHSPPPGKGYGYAILSSFLINCCYFCFFFPPSLQPIRKNNWKTILLPIQRLKFYVHQSVKV